jgi:hypothetical protein
MGALDEILATIRRLPLSERLRLIERATLEVAEDTPKPAAIAERERRLSVDEFLAARLTLPPGVGPVSLQDMDRAIAEGAKLVKPKASRLTAVAPNAAHLFDGELEGLLGELADEVQMDTG